VNRRQRSADKESGRLILRSAGRAPGDRFAEEIMSKFDTMTTDTGAAGDTAALTDKKLDAVTGGMFNAFANFGDIKGECTDARTPAAPSPLPVPYPIMIA
jgi:hypothetical protein